MKRQLAPRSKQKCSCAQRQHLAEERRLDAGDRAHRLEPASAGEIEVKPIATDAAEHRQERELPRHIADVQQIRPAGTRDGDMPGKRSLHFRCVAVEVDRRLPPLRQPQAERGRVQSAPAELESDEKMLERRRRLLREVEGEMRSLRSRLFHPAKRPAKLHRRAMQQVGGEPETGPCPPSQTPAQDTRHSSRGRGFRLRRGRRWLPPVPRRRAYRRDPRCRRHDQS